VHGVLVSKEVTSLDSVVSVPAPVILGHVSKGGVDSSLSGDSVGTGGEQPAKGEGDRTQLASPTRVSREGVRAYLVMQAVYEPVKMVVSIYLCDGSGAINVDLP